MHRISSVFGICTQTHTFLFTSHMWNRKNGYFSGTNMSAYMLSAQDVCKNGKLRSFYLNWNLSEMRLQILYTKSQMPLKRKAMKRLFSLREGISLKDYEKRTTLWNQTTIWFNTIEWLEFLFDQYEQLLRLTLNILD